MAVKQLIKLDCDVCMVERVVEVAESAEVLDGCFTVRKQAGAKVEEYFVCSAGCLRQFAQVALEAALAPSK